MEMFRVSKLSAAQTITSFKQMPKADLVNAATELETAFIEASETSGDAIVRRACRAYTAILKEIKLRGPLRAGEWDDLRHNVQLIMPLLRQAVRDENWKDAFLQATYVCADIEALSYFKKSR